MPAVPTQFHSIYFYALIMLSKFRAIHYMERGNVPCNNYLVDHSYGRRELRFPTT